LESARGAVRKVERRMVVGVNFIVWDLLMMSGGK
jgi:hypothetical protein